MAYATYQYQRDNRFRTLFAAVGTIVTGLVLAFAMLAPAFAVPTGTSTTFGDATEEADGVHLFYSTTQPYSGIDFEVEPGTTVDEITSLEATLAVLEGNCGGGSPRYVIETATGNIVVYVGDAPSFTNCTDGSTGNLIDDEDLRVDTSQVGGTFYDTWANALTLAGTDEVTGVSLVVDGFSGVSQEFLVTSANVAGVAYNFVEPEMPEEATTKEECKNGGWMNFQAGYKNQGQCIASVVSSENSRHNRQ